MSGDMSCGCHMTVTGMSHACHCCHMTAARLSHACHMTAARLSYACHMTAATVDCLMHVIWHVTVTCISCDLCHQLTQASQDGISEDGGSLPRTLKEEETESLHPTQFHIYPCCLLIPCHPHFFSLPSPFPPHQTG